MKVIKNYKDNPGYHEEPQHYPCKFAFALLNKNVVKIQHKPVLCRDYLLDTLAWKAGIPFPDRGDIYGYSFNGEIEDFPCLYVQNLPHTENLHYFYEVEKKFGILRQNGTYAQITNKKDCYLLIGDKKWMQCTVWFSFWTWMIRNFLYPEVPYTTIINESTYKEIELDFAIDSLIKINPTTVWNCKSENPDDYHGSNGFISYLSFPKWSVYA